ncbi:latrophilin Cirl-like isoform X2 [Macrosteles quadrilineatus]|uniref:latrophilin Cirl-like isoform X2 n=1 Tax=Macrosteles quadrilineatus TaxID=74068 RepID=UPI0023E2B281|nr:latrophilin Cirl-like isoform X2 [Macrosteles quadrilineatus]
MQWLWTSALLVSLINTGNGLARNTLGEKNNPALQDNSEFNLPKEQHRYDTAYACEGKTLKIECKDGELIHLIRANYGRFSITICNDHGNTEWSVNCMSPKSLRVLHSKCTQHQNCSIQASTSLFADPCPGTLKYLEAHYQCVPAAMTTTTTRPSPPWLMTSQPSVWSTAKPVTVRPGPPPPPPIVQFSPPTSTRPPSPPAPPLDLDSDEAEETTTPPPTTVTSSSTLPSTTGEVYTGEKVLRGELCSPTSARGLYWNWTQVGDLSAQPCPGGATGLARWRCVPGPDPASDPHRHPASPDLSECRSVWLTTLDSRITEGDTIISIANDLCSVTESKTLYGGDMMTTTKIIKKMAEKMSIDIQTFPDPRQREAIVTELLHGVVKTSSNLLDSSQLASWRDLTHKEQMMVATSLLVGLEENSFLLADTVIREKTVTHGVKNILLSVRVVELRNVGAEVFPAPGSLEGLGAGGGSSVPGGNWIRLEREALMENSEGGLVRLVFVAFDRLEEILQLESANATRLINSKVISASLGKGRHIQLSDPVTVCLRHIRIENVTNPTCVFWDYTTSSWSEEGCRVESTNLTHTICKCDHLTNFAILMDVQATYLPPSHTLALQVITYIGCIISVVCLILAIITFQLFRGLKSDRTTIHKHLCGCLLVAEVLFLAGIGQTDQAIVCGVIAGLLHFFFLCAFAWMFLEGFQLYVMLIEVFEAEKSRLRWYYMFAYGAPTLIVAVSCFIDHKSYGTDRYCWLRADNFFIFSFVGPVILVILANLVFLSMAIYMMCRHANASVSMKSKEHSRLASAKAWLRGAIVLVFLLGLTWTFGLLYLNEESVFMAYIFTVLNSLQGLFIFVFHCVQNEKVQKEYRKMLRRQPWLVKCLGCVGETSTSSGSGSGSGSGKERRSSLYTGSNQSHSGHTHTDQHGTSYFLQRGWSSRSTAGVPQAGPAVEVAGPTVATLPHHYTHRSPHTTIPKSATTTWDPLHKPPTWKNISFKTYSRDSGHGGSEREESPRGVVGIHNHNHSGGERPRPSYQYHKQDCMPPHSGRGRAASPWNHTYTEIREQHVASAHEDPVYEEIERERERERERHEVSVSDMSDEDGRRQSDMSRQSSRSYGDHRPLIPYSPPPAPNFQAALDAALRHRLEQARTQGVVQGSVAVLDGETVVCHLTPDLYSCRTMIQQPYSEC